MPFGEINLTFDLRLVASAVLGGSGGCLAVGPSFSLSLFEFEIDKIHFVECKILTCKCAGPPDVNFPPFHRLRGGYLNVTLSLKLMTRGRGWEVQWPGRKEG